MSLKQVHRLILHKLKREVFPDTCISISEVIAEEKYNCAHPGWRYPVLLRESLSRDGLGAGEQLCLLLVQRVLQFFIPCDYSDLCLQISVHWPVTWTVRILIHLIL